MKQVILTFVLVVASMNAQADRNRDEILRELIDRVLLLEKQVELIDKMVEQNTELAKTNRTLNQQNAKLMKLLHPKELSEMKE